MPGQVLHKVPLFGWAIFVTAVLLLLSLPVLAGILIIILPALNSAIFWKQLNITQSDGNEESLSFLWIFRDNTPGLFCCKNKYISRKYISTSYLKGLSSKEDKPKPGILVSSENNYNKNFACYLTGLIEGDGSIIIPKTERSLKGKLNYPSIKIAFDLRDFPLAQLIQKELSHGSLSRMKGINAYLLSIDDYKGVLLLIELLNGNMRTSKIHFLYDLIDWYNNKHSLNIIKKPLDRSPINSNSWLSGFIEADGSFSLFINKKSIRIRFSITQTSKNKIGFSNENIMNLLAKFLDVKISVYQRKKSPYSLELTVKTQSILKNEILIDYLNEFSLWSGKYLNYKDWIKGFEIFKKVAGIKEKPAEVYIELTKIKKGMNSERTIYNWDHLKNFYNLKE